MLSSRLALIFVCAVASCGGVPGSDRPDAEVPEIDAPGTDAPPPARCNPAAPFSTPTPLGSLNTGSSDEGGWLSPDELTIYFDSTRTGSLGGYDVFMATRADREAPFANIAPVMGINDAGHQRGPNVTADGRTLYALIGTAPNYEIARATRSSASVAFGALSPVAELNTASNDETASILADGSAIYLSSNRSGTYKIYRSRLDNGTFQTPSVVSGVDLNDAFNDSGGVTTADELTLFFVSDRPGGVGSSDIWMATRASTADGFGPSVNVQALNTAGLDGVAWVSPDGCVIYLAGGPCCTYDLSVAVRGK